MSDEVLPPKEQKPPVSSSGRGAGEEGPLRGPKTKALILFIAVLPLRPDGLTKTPPPNITLEAGLQPKKLVVEMTQIHRPYQICRLTILWCFKC